MTEPTPPTSPTPPRRPRHGPRRGPKRRPRPAAPAAPTLDTTTGEPVTHVVIGRVAAPWGIKGELKLMIESDSPERFTELKRVYLGEELTPYEVERSRLHGGRFAVLKLAGIDTPEAGDPLRRQIVQVPVEEQAPLPEGVWYWHQLIGLDVVTTAGDALGKLAEIIETGSNDVYVVRDGKREVLIPATDEVIRSVDLVAKRMVVEPLPGLLD